MEKFIRIFGMALLFIFAIILVFPIFWMAKGGFESIGTIMKVPPNFILVNPTLYNYEHLFVFPIFRWALNSFIIAGSVTVISVSTACLSGYAFAKKRFFLKNVLFWILLCTMMIPLQVRIIPMFLLVKKIGLYDSYPGIFLPMCAGAGYMFLARQYMTTIPQEFIDSARIDGASELRIFVSIIIPIAKPLVAALSIFSFVNAWGDFLWPLLIATSNKAKTLPIGVVGVAAMPSDLMDIGMAMAGATLVALPLIVIFFIFQKYFVKGLTLGGLKG